MDDMLTAMARELIENKGIGESADSIWRNVQQLRPLTSAEGEAEEAPIEQADLTVSTMLPLTVESVPDTALVEAARVPRGSPHKTTESAQLSLF
jgi:hypothetical protein